MTITLLGTGSALPAHGRHPSAQLIQSHGKHVLLDCGEGTQMQLDRYGLHLMRIDHIFISHLHGDHYFGLPGLLSSMALLGRSRELHLYADPALPALLHPHLQWETGFVIHHHPLNAGERALLFQTDKIEVHSFPVIHSVPTHGFVLKEKKRLRRLLPDAVREQGIPRYFYKALTEGQDYTDKYGQVVPNERVTEAGDPDKVYVYSADTRYEPELVSVMHHADLLYHEATYLHSDADKAIQRLHSTAHEAACMARDAQVKRLLIGHFSSKHKELSPLLTEARQVFPDTELGLEGSSWTI